MALATATTSTEKQEKKVEADFFHIDMIPDAMSKMGWEVAPKIMRHWFSITPEYSFSESTKNKLLDDDARTIDASKVNDSIVTMEWAKKFEKVSSGIKALTAGWNTQNGRKVLRKKLQALGNYEQKCIFIGNSDDVKTLDATAQVNFMRIGSKTDTINDWYGAMGNCNLKVCLKGYTSTLSGKHILKVDSLGFYLKDTYDFLDDNKLGLDIPELLGVWGKKGILTKAETAVYMSSYTSGFFGRLARHYSGFVPVFNADFKEWQKKHHSGGDFIVFSDVLWLPPLEKDREIEL